MRIGKDPQTGLIDLAACVNLRLDPTGRPALRPGQKLLYGGSFHSVFVRGRDCYLGYDDTVARLTAAMSLVDVTSGLVGTRISFVWTPLGIYYANGLDRGRLNGDTASPWQVGAPPRAEDVRYYTGPPERALHLELFSQRLLAAEDNVLWRSQPNHYDLFRKGADYNLFPGRIRMVRAVAGGVYVSDDSRTFFLNGRDPAEWSRDTVMECPAMEWSDQTDLVEPSVLGYEGKEPYAVWVSADGLVYGSPEGVIITPTTRRIKVPRGFSRGASVIMDSNIVYNLHV